MTILDLDKRIKAVNKELLKVLAVDANRLEIAGLNKEQMLAGKTAKGEGIRPKYSPQYEKRKRKMGYSLDGSPDLMLEGYFQSSMRVFSDIGEYIITSTDEKTRFLVERYDDIFGLTDENKERAQIEVTRKFIELYKAEVGLQ